MSKTSPLKHKKGTLSKEMLRQDPACPKDQIVESHWLLSENKNTFFPSAR